LLNWELKSKVEEPPVLGAFSSVKLVATSDTLETTTLGVVSEEAGKLKLESLVEVGDSLSAILRLALLVE
jgi:hypothetical protein